MQKTITILAKALCLSFLAPAAAQAQDLLLYYNFNTPQANKHIVDNSGNDRTGRIAGADSNFSANGTGVSGKPGDYAFYNKAESMGSSGGNAGYVDGSLDSLTSFTITMWFKTEEDIHLGNSARLFDITGSSQILLAGVGQGNVNVFSGSSDLTRTGTNAKLGATGEWVFVAVSYSYSGSVGTWSIYAGSHSEADSLVLVGTRSSGNVNGALDFDRIYFGSISSGGRAFDGWMDDIRIYGATEGASGALSQAAIDAIRIEAINHIPESSTTMLLIGSAALCLAALQKLWRHQRQAA